MYDLFTPHERKANILRTFDGVILGSDWHFVPLSNILLNKSTDELTKEMISSLTDNENNCCLQPASPHCVSNIFYQRISHRLSDIASCSSSKGLPHQWNCLLFLSSAPLCFYAGISSIPVLSDDRLLSGQSITYWVFFRLHQGQRGRGRAGMMLSASKMCAVIRTKHSASVDRAQPCSLGDVRLFICTSWRLGQAKCALPWASWNMMQQHTDKCLYLYFLMFASLSLSQNAFIVSVTTSILASVLAERKTCHFTALYRFIFQPVIAK